MYNNNCSFYEMTASLKNMNYRFYKEMTENALNLTIKSTLIT